jgi:hypothetical protein
MQLDIILERNFIDGASFCSCFYPMIDETGSTFHCATWFRIPLIEVQDMGLRTTNVVLRTTGGGHTLCALKGNCTYQRGTNNPPRYRISRIESSRQAGGCDCELLSLALSKLVVLSRESFG